MADVKRLLHAATPLPWIRPWADLRVRALGDDDLFGRDVTKADLGGISKAQSNLDLAVAAVNRLPDYEAAVDALETLVEDDTYIGLDKARAALARLREQAVAPTSVGGTDG